MRTRRNDQAGTSEDTEHVTAAWEVPPRPAGEPVIKAPRARDLVAAGTARRAA